MLSNISSTLKANAKISAAKAMLCAAAYSMALHTQAADVVGDCPIANYKNALLAAVNAARAQSQACGNAADAVGWHAQLAATADAHSHDMAAQQFFSHANKNGEQISKRARKFGYGYSKVGENIAAGQKSVAEVMTTWLQSPSHCSNIMDSSFVHLGVSCKYNARSDYQYYWTLTLGSPKP